MTSIMMNWYKLYYDLSEEIRKAVKQLPVTSFFKNRHKISQLELHMNSLHTQHTAWRNTQASCQAVSKPVWHIPLLCVQWKTSDDGQRNCLKHVEFYSKKKFEKLMHIVGFVIRIYHEFHPDPARKLSANLYDIYHCCVYSEKLLMMDRGTVWNM